MESKDLKLFTWYTSYTKALEDMNPHDAYILFMAIIKYGTYGMEPIFFKDLPKEKEEKLYATMPKIAFRSIFEAMRVNLDNSIKSYHDGYKGAGAGAKGGRPRKGETAAEAKARRAAEASEVYVPTQVPDECWDYIEDKRDIPPIPSGLDIDISQDLI